MTGQASSGQAVALVLAVGMCTALNLFTFGVLYDAIASAGPGLSENATQILTGWGGGIVGVIGAVVGYRAGESNRRPAAAETPQTPGSPTIEPPPAPTPVETTTARVAAAAARHADTPR